MAGGRVRENAVGLIRLRGDGGSCGRSLIPCMSSVDGEPLSREGRPGRGRGGGRSDAAGPKKGGGSPPVLLMGLSYFLGPRTADRGLTEQTFFMPCKRMPVKRHFLYGFLI